MATSEMVNLVRSKWMYEKSKKRGMTQSKVLKMEILSLIKQLKRVPLLSSNSNSKTLKRSLVTRQTSIQLAQLSKTHSVDRLSSQLSLQRSLSSSVDFVSESLSHHLSSLLAAPQASSAPQQIVTRITNLKLKTRTLSAYIKLLVNDYLFDTEFVHLFQNSDPASIRSRKQRFLKLLESLLNNNILNPNSQTRKYLTLSSIDDPLIRFLIINKIILVSETNPNQVALRDLSYDI